MENEVLLTFSLFAGLGFGSPGLLNHFLLVLLPFSFPNSVAVVSFPVCFVFVTLCLFHFFNYCIC